MQKRVILIAYKLMTIVTIYNFFNAMNHMDKTIK